MQPEIIKLLDENLEEKFLDIGLGNEFFFYIFDTKVQTAKAKINKLDCTKLKIFFIAKDIINKMKRYNVRHPCNPCPWQVQIGGLQV